MLLLWGWMLVRVSIMKTCFCNMADAVKIKPQYLDAVGDDIWYELRIVDHAIKHWILLPING